MPVAPRQGPVDHVASRVAPSAGDVSDEEHGEAEASTAGRRRRGASLKDALSRPPWTLADTVGAASSRPVDRSAHRFANAALRHIFGGMVVLTIVVTGLNRWRLSLGWTAAALAICAFAVRARIETLRDAFHADSRRRRAQEPGAESAEWINGLLERIASGSLTQP